MSFGFSIGDFLTLGTLTLKLYLSFKSAPSEFSQLSRDLHSFHIVVADLTSQANDAKSALNRHGTPRRLELMALCNNLVATLEELQDLQERYQRMGRISWLRVSFGQQDLIGLRSKLNVQIAAVDSFVNSLTMGAMSRMEPMMERIFRHLDEQAKGSLDKAQTVLSAKIEGTENEAAWAMLELDLRTEGFPQQYILDHREQIKAVLASVVESNYLEGTGEIADSVYADDSISQVGSNSMQIPESGQPLQKTTISLDMDTKYSNLEVVLTQPPTMVWIKGLSREREAARFKLMNHGFGLQVFDVPDPSSKVPPKVEIQPPEEESAMEVVTPAKITIPVPKIQKPYFFRAHSKTKSVQPQPWTAEKKMVISPIKIEYLNENNLRKPASKEEVALKFLKNNAVCWAVSKGEITALRLLIERGCDPSASNSEGSAVVVAAATGRWDILTLLVKAGADIKTPLIYSPPAAVVPTVSQKPDVDVKTKARGLLQLAAKANKTEIIELLLVTNEADVNNFQKDCGYTALHFAVTYGAYEAARLLLMKGATVDALTASGQSPLHLAVIQMNQLSNTSQSSQRQDSQPSPISTILLLLHNGADVNKQNSLDGATSLFYAISAANVEAAKILLERGAYVAVKTTDRRTLLEVAVQLQHIPLVKILLQNGAHVDVIGSNARTPLQEAVDLNNLELVVTLIEAGASVTAGVNPHLASNTVLHTAVRAQNMELVRKLIDHGAHVDVKGNDARTPLQEAVNLNNLELVVTLIEAGASVTAEFDTHFVIDTVLHTAVRAQNMELVKKLIQHGADVDGTGKSRSTPLQEAIKLGNARLVEVLIEAGANMNFPIEQNIYTSPGYIEWLLMEIPLDNTEIVELLLKGGADVNRQSHNGETNLLCEAVKLNKAELVRILIEAGADVNARLSSNGENALHKAVRNNNMDMVDILLEAGAHLDVNDNYRTTPLLVAIALDRIKLVEKLLERADVNADAYNSGAGILQVVLKLRPWYLVPRRILRLLVWKGASLKNLSPSDRALCEMWQKEPLENWYTETEEPTDETKSACSTVESEGLRK